MANNTSQKGGNAVWKAIYLHLFDAGLTNVLGFIAGFGAGIFVAQKGRPPSDAVSMISTLSMVIAFVASAYASFALYRKYTKEMIAIVTLVIISLIFGFMQLGTPSASDFTTVQRVLLLLIVQPLVYVIGWLVAKQTSLKIYIPPKGWILAGAIIGGVISFVEIVSLVALLSN